MRENPHLEDEKARLDAYEQALKSLRDTVSDPGLEQDAARMMEWLDARIDTDLSKHVKIKRWLTTISVAAAVVLVAGLWMGRPRYKAPDVSAYENNSGTVKQFSLPDGTSVVLSEGASLTYRLASGRRLATLEGSGYFDVARDTLSPFIVSTAGLDIKVLGTAFSVHSPEGSSLTDVILERGSVRLLSKGGTPLLRLVPNQKAVYNAVSGDIAVEQVYARPLIQQQFSLVSLDNASVEEIIAAIESVYGIKVSASGYDPSRHYHINFLRTESVGDVLNVLELMTGGHYSSTNASI